jgi:hypothetical protein
MGSSDLVTSIPKCTSLRLQVATQCQWCRRRVVLVAILQSSQSSGYAEMVETDALFARLFSSFQRGTSAMSMIKFAGAAGVTYYLLMALFPASGLNVQ